MLAAGKAKMAVEAAKLCVDRPRQGSGVDLQRDLFPVPELDAHGVLVTAHAVFSLGDERSGAGNGRDRVRVVTAGADRRFVLLGHERGMDRGFL